MSRYDINFELVKMMKWVMKTFLKSNDRISLPCLRNSLYHAWDELVEEGEIVLDD